MKPCDCKSKDKKLESIMVLCVEGSEFLSKIGLAEEILKVIQPPEPSKCVCHIHDRAYYGCKCGADVKGE